MADNVLFCWPEKHKEWGKGVAVYIDRVEGRPDVKQLCFLYEKGQPASGRAQRKVSALEFTRVGDKEHRDFTYAEGMVERITEMQGLPMQEKASWASGSAEGKRGENVSLKNTR